MTQYKDIAECSCGKSWVKFTPDPANGMDAFKSESKNIRLEEAKSHFRYICTECDSEVATADKSLTKVNLTASGEVLKPIPEYRTISVSEEIYHALLEISKGMNNQDNRATASPYFFQIRDEVKQYRPEGSGSHYTIVDTSYDPFEITPTPEGIRDFLDAFGYTEEELPDNLDQMNERQIEDWLEDHSDFKIQRYYYDIEHELKNVFFTEDGCKKHIENNKHRYHNPVDFVSYGFRNPELETVINFLTRLIES